MVNACLAVYSLPYSLGIVWKIIPIHKESSKKQDLDYSRAKIICNENYIGALCCKIRKVL